MKRKDVDSGWAWVVLVASYMNLLMLSGVCYIGGMFQVVFLEQFHQSVGLTAWVTSLYASLMLISGPLASVIAYYLDCRASVMLGGILLACGLAVSSFSTSLPALFVTFGIIAGLGLGLSYTPSVVVVNFYFEKRRTLVTSVVLSASGTGLLLAPLCFQYLLDNFAWRECLVILAGICIHVTLFGALMYPIHERKKPGDRTSSGCCKQTGSSQDDVIASDEADDVASSRMLTETANFQLGYSSRNLNSNNIAEHISAYEEEIHRNDNSSDPDRTLEVESETNINSLNSGENESRLNQKRGSSQLDIFKNRGFVAFLLQMFLLNAGCAVFNIYLPAFCESYGTPTMKVALVMSVNGPANMVSSVLLGAFVHTHGKDVWVLYLGALMVTSTVLFLIPTFARTYAGQLVAVVLMGTYLGGAFALSPVLTIHCVGLRKLATAFGVTMICSGLGWLVAPPTAGWIVDLIRSYDSSMYLAGVIVFLSVLVGLVVPQLLPPSH